MIGAEIDALPVANVLAWRTRRRTASPCTHFARLARRRASSTIVEIVLPIDLTPIPRHIVVTIQPPLRTCLTVREVVGGEVDASLATVG